MTGYLLLKRTRYLLLVLEGDVPNNYGFRTFHFHDDPAVVRDGTPKTDTSLCP